MLADGRSLVPAGGGKTISEQTGQQSRRRFPTRPVLIIVMLVVATSAVAYGLVYGLNNVLALGSANSDYPYPNWRPHRDRFGYQYNATSSFRATSTVDNVSVTGFNVADSNHVHYYIVQRIRNVAGINDGHHGTWAFGQQHNSSRLGFSHYGHSKSVGTGSLSSTWHVGVLIVPYTGA